MIPQNVKDYFSRHFLGKVKVNFLPPSIPQPRSFALKRSVATHPIRTRMQAMGSVLFAYKSISCSSQGFRFASQMAKVKGAKIARYAPQEIKARTKSKLKTKVKEDVKRAAILPQERTNRLSWQTVRPKKEGEVILAWFGPIIEDAVVKLTLHKQHGTLLIWYNPQSRRFDAKGLYLYRRLGMRENLEWRWM